jgi:hypothetical protein
VYYKKLITSLDIHYASSGVAFSQSRYLGKTIYRRKEKKERLLIGSALTKTARQLKGTAYEHCLDSVLQSKRLM